VSRHGEITLPFGAEERKFRLGIRQWEAIEARCDAGPPELLSRLRPLVNALQMKLGLRQIMASDLMGRWRIHDVREPILQGLIGGGMGSTEAGVLVRAVFDEKLSLEFAPTAYLILEAAWFGPEDDPPGETRAAPETPPKRRRSRAARPASPT